MGKGSLFQIGENVELWRMLSYLSILVVFVIVFEQLLHHLEHKLKKYPKYHEMMTKVFGELMILGFIGLLIKLVKEFAHLDAYGAPMIAFQAADLTIFILAIALILQSICVFMRLRRRNMQVDQAELISSNDLYDLIKRHEDSQRGKRCCWSFSRVSLIKKGSKASTAVREIQPSDFHELVQMRILRHFFLRTYGLPELFPFSKYLRQAQDNQITHMIEVEMSTWILLLAIAWALNGVATMVFELLKEEREDADDDEHKWKVGGMPYAIVIAFLCFTWLSVLLNLVVAQYFSSAIQQLVNKATTHTNEASDRMECLQAVATNEEDTVNHEMALDAIAVMESVREAERKRRVKRSRHYLTKHDTGFQLLSTIFRNVTGQSTKEKQSTATTTTLDTITITEGDDSITAATVELRWFSRKAWHFVVMSLLVLNGFYVALFAQCILYQMDNIYNTFGASVVVLIPMPLLINMVVFQPWILREFILISSVVRVDDTALGNVIDHFTETVQLRSEFVRVVTDFLQRNHKTVGDLCAELAAQDAEHSGLLEVDHVRLVLQHYGFKLSFFRFNSVAKLLFRLHGTKIEYHQIETLLALGQDEGVRRLYQETLMLPDDGMTSFYGSHRHLGLTSTAYLESTSNGLDSQQSDASFEHAAPSSSSSSSSSTNQAKPFLKAKKLSRANSSAARSLYQLEYYMGDAPSFRRTSASNLTPMIREDQEDSAASTPTTMTTNYVRM